MEYLRNYRNKILLLLSTLDLLKNMNDYTMKQNFYFFLLLSRSYYFPITHAKWKSPIFLFKLFFLNLANKIVKFSLFPKHSK